MGEVTLKISADVQGALNGTEKLNKSVDELNKDTQAYNQKATQGFNQTGQAANSAAKGITNVSTSASKGISVFKSLATSIGIAFSVGAIINFSKRAVAEWDAQEKAVQKLRIAIGGNEDATRRLVKQSEELARTTLFNDDDIINAQAMIGLLSKDEDVIKRLMPLVTDLATAKGMDLASAADLVSKSIGSSTNALGRYGIEISGAVGSSERLESAITNLNKAVGGQAEGAAKVGASSIQQLNKAWGEFMESVGSAEGQMGEFWGFFTNWLNDIAEYAFKTKEQIIQDSRDDTFIKALEEDAIEVKKISESLQKSGMDAAAADKRAKELEILSLQRLIGFYGDNAAAVEDLQKRIAKLKEGEPVLKAQVDSLDSLKAKLAELKKEQSAAPLIEFASFKPAIDALEKQIGLYEKQGEEIKKNKEEQDKLNKSIEEFSNTWGNFSKQFAEEDEEIKKRAEETEKLTTEVNKLTEAYQDEAEAADIPFDTAEIVKEYEKLNKFIEDHPLFAKLGFENEEQLNQVKEYVGQLFDFAQQIVDQQVEATERVVEDQNQRIDEQEELVNREFELKKEGLANNYQVEQENLQKMQKARDQAIKDREKAIKLQRTMSTIESGIALVSAAANIMKGFSGIPIVGVVLGLAAVAAMIAGFVAAQGKVKDATQLAEGGLLTGKRHSQGGIRIPGTNIEVEGDEFVTNRRSTSKYLPLLEAINKDDRDGMRLFFDRKFINRMPQQRLNFDIDKSKKLGEIVRNTRKNNSEVIYGPGYIIERVGNYTKKINLN